MPNFRNLTDASDAEANQLQVTPTTTVQVHEFDDTDRNVNSHHHTLGNGLNQAASGSRMTAAENSIKQIFAGIGQAALPMITHRRTTAGGQKVTAGPPGITLSFGSANDNQGGIVWNGTTRDFTIAQAGLYLLAVGIQFDNAGVGGGTRRMASIKVNAAQIALNDLTAGVFATGPTVTTTKVLAVGDKVSFGAYQNSAGDLNLYPDATTNWCVVSKIDGLKGDPGDAGSGGGGGTLTWTQSTSSAVWTVSHSLGYNPSVTVIDSAGTQVEGDVVYTSTNSLKLTFSAAFTGVAYLS